MTTETQTEAEAKKLPKVMLNEKELFDVLAAQYHIAKIEYQFSCAYHAWTDDGEYDLTDGDYTISTENYTISLSDDAAIEIVDEGDIEEPIWDCFLDVAGKYIYKVGGKLSTGTITFHIPER